MARDGSERAAAQARVDAQLPISAKLPYADVVLDNSGGPPELDAQVTALIERLRAAAGWSWRLSRWLPPYAFASALATLVFRAVKRRRRSRSRRRDGAARTGL
jgi:dephospho-CoA kinase